MDTKIYNDYKKNLGNYIVGGISEKVIYKVLAENYNKAVERFGKDYVDKVNTQFGRKGKYLHFDWSVDDRICTSSDLGRVSFSVGTPEDAGYKRYEYESYLECYKNWQHNPLKVLRYNKFILDLFGTEGERDFNKNEQRFDSAHIHYEYGNLIFYKGFYIERYSPTIPALMCVLTYTMDYYINA